MIVPTAGPRSWATRTASPPPLDPRLEVVGWSLTRMLAVREPESFLANPAPTSAPAATPTASMSAPTTMSGRREPPPASPAGPPGGGGEPHPAGRAGADHPGVALPGTGGPAGGGAGGATVSPHAAGGGGGGGGATGGGPVGEGGEGCAPAAGGVAAGCGGVGGGGGAEDEPQLQAAAGPEPASGAGPGACSGGVASPGGGVCSSVMSGVLVLARIRSRRPGGRPAGRGPSPERSLASHDNPAVNMGAVMPRLTCALGPDSAGDLLAGIIGGASDALDLAVYEVGPSYAGPLAAAASRGVRVRLLVDGHAGANAASARLLAGCGAEVRVWARRPAEAHWKLLVAGDATLAVGSGNLI